MKTTLKVSSLRALRWFVFVAACASMLAFAAALVGKHPQGFTKVPPHAGQCYAGTIDMHSLFNIR